MEKKKKASSKTDYNDKATLVSAYWLILVKHRDSLANLLKVKIYNFLLVFVSLLLL